MLTDEQKMRIKETIIGYLADVRVEQEKQIIPILIELQRLIKKQPAIDSPDKRKPRAMQPKIFAR